MCKFDKIGLFIGTFLLGCVLFSCSAFNQDVKGFLQKYTETAAIEKMEIAGTYPRNSAGTTCLTSDEDVNINFYLRNPQKYDLIFKYEFDNSQTGDFSQTIPLTYEQGFDKTSLKVTLPQRFLLEVDKSNKDLSGKITIKEPASGRDFDYYPLTLHANSVPPKVENACFQLDREIDGEYIICFFLPDVDSTSVAEMIKHKNDTRKIYFNNELRYFSHGKIYKDASLDSSGVWNFENEDTNFLTVAPVLYPSETGYVFKSSECPLGYSPVYYMSKIGQSTDKLSFAIKVVDDEGLSSVSEFSNQAKELSSPFISNIAELRNGVSVDEDTGLYEIEISHNGKTVDGDDCGEVNISYSVYDIASYEIPLITGNANGKAKIKLSKGRYKITAKANKAYYITSTEYSSANASEAPDGIWLKSPAKFYISENGSNAEGLGSRTSPFRSIQKAIEVFNSGVSVTPPEFNADDGCEIVIMNDITPDAEYDTFAGTSVSEKALVNLNGNYSYIISGYNGETHSISAGGTSQTGDRRVIFNQSEKPVTLKNIIVTGGYLTDDEGSGYYDTTNGTVIFDNVQFTANTGNKGAVSFNGILQIDSANIYDNKNISGEQSNVYIKENKTITVTKNLNGSKIGITTEKVPQNASETVVITSGYGYGTINDSLPGIIFASDSSFGITYEDANYEAVVAMSGGGANIGIAKKPEIVLVSHLMRETDVAAEIYCGGSLTFKIVNNEGSEITDSCNISYKLKMFKKEISADYYSADSLEKGKVNISSSIEPGTYTLVVSYLYGIGKNAVSAEDEFIVAVKEKDDLTLMTTPPASGTSVSVSTVSSLNKISEWVKDGNTLQGVTITLEKDITLDESFNGIGYYYEDPGTHDVTVKSFAGTFNGNGHSVDITNMKSDTFGLFVSVEGNAHVKNVVVTGTVNAPTSYSGMIYTLVGNSIVENCESRVGYNGNGWYGSIVNWIGGGVVKNCRNYGDMNTVANNVGGIVNSWNGGTIESCENYGNIICTSTAYNIGGIVSETGNFTTGQLILNCANYGNITAENGTQVGGVVGSVQGAAIIENCANYGNLTALHTVGGLAGQISSSTMPKFINCLIAGRIELLTDDTTLALKRGFVAGSNTGSALYYDGAYYLKDNIYCNGILCDSHPCLINMMGTGTGKGTSFTHDSSGCTAEEIPPVDLLFKLNNYSSEHSSEGCRQWKYGSNGYPVLVEAE